MLHHSHALFLSFYPMSVLLSFPNTSVTKAMGQTLITVTRTTHDHSQVVLLAGRGWSDENKCFQLKVFPYIDVVALRPRAGTLPAF